MTRFGISEPRLCAIEALLRSEMGASHRFKVWVFGSRARGTHRPYSDLDILVDCDPPLSRAARDRLAEKFEESDLPFKVDLVPIDELVDAYRERIRAERALLFES